MYKSPIIFSTFLFLMGVIVAKPIMAYPDLSAELITPGELCVATDPHAPPFSLRDQHGGLMGIEYQFFREISKRLGLVYKPVIVPWADLISGLEAGLYDVVSAPLNISAESQERVLFCASWLDSGGKLLTRADTAISKPSHMRGRLIGALKSSLWENLAYAYGARDVRRFDNTLQAIDALIKGDVEGLVVDAFEADHAVKSKAGVLKVCPDFLNHVHKGWAVHKDRTNLAKALNDVLQQMKDDGTYQAIIKKTLQDMPAQSAGHPAP